MTNEFDLISRYFNPLAGPEGLGLNDDAACVSQSSSLDSIITKDLLIEGVHFRSLDPVNLIAHKALAVNVSDCIAKGAKPNLYWLGLALPKNTNESWFAEFSGGLDLAQRSFGCKLAGGDTTATNGPKVISLTLMGAVAAGAMITRSGASDGDNLYVTGTLGDAALGLWCLENNSLTYTSLVDAYQRPIPPVAFGQGLEGIASASADISDGLIADAGHIASSSGMAITIWRDRLPMSQQARQLTQKNQKLLPLVWAGGDDYQIVFTAPEAEHNNLEKLAKFSGVSIAHIGKVSAGHGVQLLDQNAEIVQVTSGGYTHF